MGENLPKKPEDLAVDVEKLDDKVKLVGLEIDKRSADLEIKIGKVEERFKEISYDFPKLRERAEEIEDLLNIINLGLVDFKNRFSDIDSRISKLEKVPEEVERRIVSLDNRLKKMDEDVKKLYTRLDEVGSIKQEVTKTLEDKIDINAQNLRKEITDNGIETEHLRKDLDALTFAIKSFERTVELTNLDDMIRRFDAVDRRILNLQAELDKSRSYGRDTAAIEGDVDTLKRRFKEMIPTVMDAMNKINEFEIKMNNKLSKVEALEKGMMSVNTVQAMTSTVIEQVKKMSELKNSMEGLYGKIMRIYDSGNVSWDRSQDLLRELSELDKLKKDFQEVRKIVEEDRLKIKNMRNE